jgi:hypothetical protein
MRRACQRRSVLQCACGRFLVLLMAGAALSSQLHANQRLGAITTNTTLLDEKRLFALGMIETGNDDRGVGPAGEVSRYQIHPAVWKIYSDSREYRNADVAHLVARQHWNYLTNYFRDRTGRDPTDFDMYVLWNTRFGFYARKEFDPQRLSPLVIDRAQRFVNLVNR